MIWWALGVLVVWLGWQFAFALCRAAAPKTEAERREDDEAQIRALIEHERKAQQKLSARPRSRTSEAGR